ncbi:MAG: AAA family ATPase, partial [Oscillospiraceae bacterium]|nr:AAA family ATPase [Oscillospiraceae bacterium]
MLKLVSDVKNIRAILKSAVFGQDKAIDVFMSGYFQASMRSILDKTRKRPRATFLFAGPPGVGKTFLAEQSAQALGLPFQRFDMSEYCDDESAVEFCGSDGVYRNSKRGNFTAFVDEHPKSVILLDEIEKAHISIIHLFLQILDAGRIRDNQTDKEISLKDTILIFTTNAGRKLYEDTESGDLSGISRKVILNALANDVDPHTGVPFFPTAICSRFASGNVVMFNHIGAHNLRAIAKKEILRHAANLQRETGMQMELDELVYTALLLSEGANADARTMTSRSEAFFNDELYELFRMVSSEKVPTGVENIATVRVPVDLSDCDAEVAKLVSAGENPRFLLLGSQETIETCRRKLPDFDIFGAQTLEEAVEIIKERELDFVLVDLCHGIEGDVDESINVADIDSPGRDLMTFLRDQKSDLPVYLLETEDFYTTEEERVTYLSRGVRDIFSLADSEEESLRDKMAEIAAILYQQSSMMKLAKANKLLSFETAQSVSEDGKTAVIRLFDFKEIVAVDSEDSKSVLSAVSRPNVRFEQVLGANDAKKELKYFVEYLKNPKKYMGSGVKAPKGVLLYGPPGTGKTMLAKAMACESGVTFIAAEGNQFLKRYVGEGPEEVHKLFRTARKYAPSILFVDEIDTIAKERRGGDHAA